MSYPLSISEFAEKLQVERNIAYGFVRFLLALGLVELKGVRQSESGKGKGENVYILSEEIEKKMTKIVRQLK